MGIYAIKPLFQKSLQPVFNLFVKYKINPDTINILAFFMSALAGLSLLFATQFHWLFLAVPVLVLFRIAFNALDGMVARALNLSSRIGEVYNELFDRLSDLAIFILLAFAVYADRTIVLIALSVVLLNSYLGILGKSAGGSRVYKGFIGKADRMLYLGIVSIVSFFDLEPMYWQIFIWLILYGTIISIIQRFVLIYKELK